MYFFVILWYDFFFDVVYFVVWWWIGCFCFVLGCCVLFCFVFICFGLSCFGYYYVCVVVGYGSGNVVGEVCWVRCVGLWGWVVVLFVGKFVGECDFFCFIYGNSLGV